MMAININLICYQSFQFQRQFTFLSCLSPLDLTGYGITFQVLTALGGTVLFQATVGSGITVDLATGTATVTLTPTQTAALVTTGLPVLTITESIKADCCGLVAPPPPSNDTQTAAVATCLLYLTDPGNNNLPPEFIGSFAIVEAP